MRPPGLARRLSSSVAVRLAVVAFIVYNANLRAITSFDTYPARLLPVAILTGSGVHLDQFTFLREPRFTGGAADSTPYFMVQRRGHWVSRYPVAPSLLATPVYALPIWLGIHEGRPLAPGVARVEVVATLLAKLAASLAMALAVAIVYLTVRRLSSARTALVLAVIYAFATSAWSVSSQGLWQSSFGQPAFALALYALVCAQQEGGRARWLGVAGLGLAVSVACRPPMVFVAAVLSVFVIRRFPRRLPAFVAAPLAVGALLVAYNLYYFDNVIGGYGDLAGTHELSLAALSVGLRGLLISPNRGLFVFSPLLLASFAGMAVVLARRTREHDELLAYVAVATVATLLQYATFSGWHGAFGFSYRFLAEILPAFVLLIVPVWGWLVATSARRALLATLVGYGVAVQMVGAFFYPCGWYRTEKEEPAFTARFFSWRDMELVQCIRAGPVDPDGLRAIRPVLGIPGGGREAR